MYGVTPPEPEAETVPVADPKQLAAKEVTVKVNAVGCVNVTDAVAVQPEKSLIVMLYVPAGKPVKLPVVFVTAPTVPSLNFTHNFSTYCIVCYSAYVGSILS